MKSETIMLSLYIISIIIFWICYIIHYNVLKNALRTVRDTKLAEEIEYKLENEKRCNLMVYTICYTSV